MTSVPAQTSDKPCRRSVSSSSAVATPVQRSYLIACCPLLPGIVACHEFCDCLVAVTSPVVVFFCLQLLLRLCGQETPNAQKAINLLKPEGGGAPLWDKAQVSCSPPSSDQIFSSASAASSSSLGNTEISSSIDTKSFSTMYFQQENAPKSSQLEKAGEQPTKSIPKSEGKTEAVAFKTDITSYEHKKQQHLSTSDTLTEGCQDEEEFEYSVCSFCENRRPNIGLKKEFSYSELYQATNGFSSKNFLSEGGFGFVYKGELKCGLKVAVKQHKDVSSQGEKEFKSEVQVLSKARHQNLVMLLGSCSEGTHRLLVYEFVCYGSLDQHLSRHAEKPLTWENRIKIALGTARGLDYLHSINIIHRDMRPNNILVTHDHESLLGDFGLARSQCGDSDETSVVGTLGYVAPEYAECGKVSTKTDVYSFGVVLLQLITGCKTIDDKFQGKSLVEWARPLLEEKNYPDLIDERIVDSHDVLQLLLMVRLAELCLNKDPTKRYTMASVLKTLENITKGDTSNSIEELSSPPLLLHGSPSEEHDPKNMNVKPNQGYCSKEKLPAAGRHRRRSRSWAKSASHDRDHDQDQATNKGAGGKGNYSREISYTDMLN